MTASQDARRPRPHTSATTEELRSNSRSRCSATATQTQAELPEQQWIEYLDDGRARAEALGNRGPIRFDDDGRLAHDILDAYHRTGFYVFTGVLSAGEVAELEAEFDELIDSPRRA